MGGRRVSSNDDNGVDDDDLSLADRPRDRAQPRDRATLANFSSSVLSSRCGWSRDERRGVGWRRPQLRARRHVRGRLPSPPYLPRRRGALVTMVRVSTDDARLVTTQSNGRLMRRRRTLVMTRRKTYGVPLFTTKRSRWCLPRRRALRPRGAARRGAGRAAGERVVAVARAAGAAARRGDPPDEDAGERRRHPMRGSAGGGAP